MRSLPILAVSALLAASGAVGGKPSEPLKPGRDGVTRPQLLSEPMPEYPPRAQRNRLGATLRMAFVVDEAGRVGDVEMLDIEGDIQAPSAVQDFEKSARRALLARRYAPAMRGGQPVPVRLEIAFQFSPEEQLALQRWLQVERGLRALAEAGIIQPGDAVAGEDGVSIPAAVKQVAPIQPHGARIRGMTSRVTLLVKVSSEGKVLDIPLARAESTEFPFDDAAAAAVRRWRFTPPSKQGAALAAWHWVRLQIPSPTP